MVAIIIFVVMYVNYSSTLRHSLNPFIQSRYNLDASIH